MEELANLTETANGEVVFVLTQKRSQVDRQTVIGKEVGRINSINRCL